MLTEKSPKQIYIPIRKVNFPFTFPKLLSNLITLVLCLAWFPGLALWRVSLCLPKLFFCYVGLESFCFVRMVLFGSRLKSKFAQNTKVLSHYSL
jgi:hypothetical protein